MGRAATVRVIGILTMGAAAVMMAASLFLPWFAHEQRTGDSVIKTDAGAFEDGNELITPAQAMWNGILAFLATLGLGGAAILLYMYHATVWRSALGFAPWIGLLGTVLGGLVVILAVTTWPPAGRGFWDASSTEFQGMTASVSWHAGPGWYLALASSALGLAASVVWMVQVLRGGQASEENAIMPPDLANAVASAGAVAPPAKRQGLSPIEVAAAKASRPPKPRKKRGT